MCVSDTAVNLARSSAAAARTFKSCVFLSYCVSWIPLVVWSGEMPVWVLPSCCTYQLPVIVLSGEIVDLLPLVALPGEIQVCVLLSCCVNVSPLAVLSGEIQACVVWIHYNK